MDVSFIMTGCCQSAIGSFAGSRSHAGITVIKVSILGYTFNMGQAVTGRADKIAHPTCFCPVLRGVKNSPGLAFLLFGFNFQLTLYLGNFVQYTIYIAMTTIGTKRFSQLHPFINDHTIRYFRFF